MVFMAGGEPKIITISNEGRFSPSIVAVAKNGGRMVKQIAKHQNVTNPENSDSSGSIAAN